MKMTNIQTIVAFLLSAPSLMGMTVDPQKIYVKNNLARRIQVTWQTSEVDFSSKIIQANNTREISTFKAILPGSIVKIEPYGDYVGYSAFPLSITTEKLQHAFNEMSQSPEDSLEVAISQGYSIYLSPTYSIIPPTGEEPKPLPNPMDAFKGLKYYPNLKDLSEKDVLRFDSYETIVIPGSYSSNPTTALDVYRYMLGIPKDFTEADVKKAFNEFALKWHPDKGNHGTDVETAQKVFNLARVAKKGLDEYLKEQSSSL